jgi:undecaprenyl-diphosphatase
MLGASLLKIVKNFSEVLAFGVEWVYLLTGFAVAFAVSMLCIKLLMNFVKKHDFKVFGWYRIALGVIVLGVFIAPLLFA